MRILYAHTVISRYKEIVYKNNLDVRTKKMGTNHSLLIAMVFLSKDNPMQGRSGTNAVILMRSHCIYMHRLEEVIEPQSINFDWLTWQNTWLNAYSSSSSSSSSSGLSDISTQHRRTCLAAMASIDLHGFKTEHGRGGLAVLYNWKAKERYTRANTTSCSFCKIHIITSQFDS